MILLAIYKYIHHKTLYLNALFWYVVYKAIDIYYYNHKRGSLFTADE